MNERASGTEPPLTSIDRSTSQRVDEILRDAVLTPAFPDDRFNRKGRIYIAEKPDAQERMYVKIDTHEGSDRASIQKKNRKYEASIRGLDELCNQFSIAVPWFGVAYREDGTYVVTEEVRGQVLDQLSFDAEEFETIQTQVNQLFNQLFDYLTSRFNSAVNRIVLDLSTSAQWVYGETLNDTSKKLYFIDTDSECLDNINERDYFLYRVFLEFKGFTDFIQELEEKYNIHTDIKLKIKEFWELQLNDPNLPERLKERSEELRELFCIT